MARSAEDLRLEVKEVWERVRHKPGLGMVLIMFDARGHRARPPIHLNLHGITNEKAARMLREMADGLDRAAREEVRIEVADAPLLVKPRGK